MAKVEKYICDVCEAVRNEANHWFVGFISESYVTFRPWAIVDDPELLSDKEARHLCGQTCAHKMLDQFLSGELK